MTAWESIAKELFSGVMGMGDPSVWMMFLIGGILIYLGVKKDYEPMLLFPMGVGCILANIPGHFAVIPTGGGEPGFLSVLYEAGIANELFPVLIFIAVGAMCEFDPLIRAPYVMLFAAAAHFGIFAAAFLASLAGFPFNEAASIGIIGAADGPTTIFVAQKFATNLLAPLTVTAFCYMSLVPIIQPPIVKLLTTKKERLIRMPFKAEKPVSWTARFLFPLMVVLIAGILAPISVPLIGALMFGNLLKVSGVTDSLSNAAQNELSNLVTLLLGITVGATMTAENILTMDVLKILVLGALAFVFGRRSLCQAGQSVPYEENQSHDRCLRHIRLPHVRPRHCEDGAEGGPVQLYYPACHGGQRGRPGGVSGSRRSGAGIDSRTGIRRKS